MPIGTKGYIENPFAGIIIANVVNYIIQEKFPDNQKAMKIASAMMSASAVMLAESVDINGIIEDFIGSIKVPAGVSLADIKLKNNENENEDDKKVPLQ